MNHPERSQQIVHAKALWCCLFRPTFVCCTHPKAGWTTFFQPFSTFFCSFQTFFSDLTTEINKKRLKKNKKTVFVYSSKLVNMQMLVHSLRGYFEIFFFGWFFTFKCFLLVFKWFWSFFVNLFTLLESNLLPMLYGSLSFMVEIIPMDGIQLLPDTHAQVDKKTYENAVWNLKGDLWNIKKICDSV